MSEFLNDYAALAAADRATAQASPLRNVRNKHFRSAECWDRLAEAELELRTQRARSPSKVKKSGMMTMEPEETDLERRVLAHARILQTLIRFLAEEQPEILSRMKGAFGAGHNIGEYEQNFSSTEQYGDMFIRAVEKEILQEGRR
ncbi:hypothetical protein [Qipengyuania mesophila]|uniref:hypothetical protein n=1 Tax=Qipengyuania mesophila TaxID=2867246 RepID=UPI0035175DA6